MKFKNQNVFDAKKYALDANACLIQRKKVSMPPIIIDLRSPEEYARDHLIGAHSLPLEYLKDHIRQLPPYAKIILYADQDETAIESLRLLKENNFNDLHFVAGGYTKLMETLKATSDEVFLVDYPKEEWETRIEHVLSDKVRPALAADGGGLRIEKIEDGKVYIHYEGACSGCPSSKTGTLNFIRNSLRIALNYDIEVEIA